jgi:hypothetical protein
MQEETNNLLRQILETQRELLETYKAESERAAEFRRAALKSQKPAAIAASAYALVCVVLCVFLVWWLLR